jgi:hypothetical protein
MGLTMGARRRCKGRCRWGSTTAVRSTIVTLDETYRLSQFLPQNSQCFHGPLVRPVPKAQSEPLQQRMLTLKHGDEAGATDGKEADGLKMADARSSEEVKDDRM